jgi:hypothetical protein
LAQTCGSNRFGRVSMVASEMDERSDVDQIYARNGVDAGKDMCRVYLMVHGALGTHGSTAA